MTSKTQLQMHLELERLQLKAPFRISGYTFTQVPAAVVTLEDGALRGRGEAAGVYYLDDTPERIVCTLEAHRPEIERGIDRDQLHQMLPAGGARNALDCALWDLEAKRVGRPVWRLAGQDRPTARVTTFTLGADHPAQVSEGAKALSHARALKLKLSGELAADMERVRAVRAARPDVWLGVDANQGYTVDALEGAMPTFIAEDVQLIEQPVRRGSEADLQGFNSRIPIAADESVQGLADIPNLRGRFQVVNVKLDKCGGLTEALAMVSEARRLGMRAMVGNMVGTSLAMAPAFIVAQLCDYVDLDGPTFIERDRNPHVEYERGAIFCPDEVWGGAA